MVSSNVIAIMSAWMLEVVVGVTNTPVQYTLDSSPEGHCKETLLCMHNGRRHADIWLLSCMMSPVVYVASHGNMLYSVAHESLQVTCVPMFFCHNFCLQ
jgi:hypothetical protein